MFNDPIDECPIKDSFSNEHFFSVSSSPWLSILSIILSPKKCRNIGVYKTKGDLSMKRNHYIGTSHIYSNIMQIKSSDNAFRMKKLKACQPFSTVKHVEANSHQSKPHAKILQCGLYWPYLFKDTHHYCKACSRCQLLSGITIRNMMSLNPILIF